MRIIDGKKIAEEVRANLVSRLSKLESTPGLAVILVGDDPASQTYVSLKEKAAGELKIHFEKHLLSSNTSQEEIIELIEKLNGKSSVNGIVVQLPLPKGLNADKIVSRISPIKDVDGFHPKNISSLLKGMPLIVPGLSTGIIKLIESTGIDLKERKAIIYANSPVFSEPLEYLLNQKGIKTVSCHADAEDCLPLTKEADIIVAAVGQPGFIKKDMVKDGSVIIDVGINHIAGKIVGDVDTDSVKNTSCWVTPVPGGVGPMTIEMLLNNVIYAHEAQQS